MLPAIQLQNTDFGEIKQRKFLWITEVDFIGYTQEGILRNARSLTTPNSPSALGSINCAT